MISIIICARTSNLPSNLSENINKTIGVAYEIISIDNTKNEFNIFEAYNKGVSQSKYPYICFMHDDILFHTQDWGKIVCRHFEDESTGAIGIAGGKYMSYMPGTWWSSGYWEQNIIHTNKASSYSSLDAVMRMSGNKSEVVALDGVWFCIRGDLFQKIEFDGNTFKGFHFYDLDISFQILNAGYKVYCVFDILIEHFSKGSYNNSWINDALLFQKKWNKSLPLTLLNLNSNEQDKLEVTILQKFIDLCQQHLPDKTVYKLGLNFILKYRSGLLIFSHPQLFLKYLKESLPVLYKRW